MFKTAGTKKTVIFLSLAAVVFLSTYVCIFVYITQSAGILTGSSGQLPSAILDNIKQVAKEKILAETVDEQQKINSYILSDQDTVSFIEQIENLGKKADVTLEVDSIGTADLSGKQKDQWGYLTLQISTKGSWAHIFDSMMMLESLPYQVEISNVMVEREPVDSSKKQPIIWDGHFTLSVLKSK